MRVSAALLLSVLCCTSLMAQTLTIGSLPRTTIISLPQNVISRTIIDLSHPATADGTISASTIRWVNGSCTGAYKVKFLRPNAPGSRLTFSLVAVRGPFTAFPGDLTTPIDPPVSVLKGDLLAVTTLVTSTTCGSPTFAIDPDAAIMSFDGDVSAGSFSGFLTNGQSIGARATATTEVLEGVIPAAGATAGNFGSFFRTSLQISNPGDGTLSGKIVFHPAGVPASATDQAITYTVSGATAKSFSDVVSFMGKSGLGTLDIISTAGGPPLVTARVYNDTPTGTSGFTEDLIPPSKAILALQPVALVTPSDLTNFRANIGVRTFNAPVTMGIKAGTRPAVSRTFTANTFVQLTQADFQGSDPHADEQIVITLGSGSAVIYMSTTDNRTNDSSVTFAHVD